MEKVRMKCGYFCGVDVGAVATTEISIIDWVHQFLAITLYFCRVFCCAMWGIWTMRNRLLHESQKPTASEIMSFIKKIWAKWMV
ncbi:hypothetical protein Gotri_000437 [Gossypium trilobum]|uniref:Transmembrane protein n=1 Tax=Gossypium trilobum TaxID=34281 RepID=A0A7J9FC73_9ROSI|nr:hypothetical protein [Gossypium trilobum]